MVAHDAVTELLAIDAYDALVDLLEVTAYDALVTLEVWKYDAVCAVIMNADALTHDAEINTFPPFKA